MKTFIISLIFACAIATEQSTPEELQPTAEDCPFLRVFDKNEDGRWEFSQDLVPDLPQLSFADVDGEAIREWVTSKQDSMAL